MKYRMFSGVLAAALAAGGTLLAAPAAYAEEASAVQAQEQTLFAAAPDDVQKIRISDIKAVDRSWFSSNLDREGPFDRKMVEERLRHTITMFERGDVDGLRAEAVPDLPPFTESMIGSLKYMIADEWGERVSFGKPYTSATQTDGEWRVACKIAVGYRKTSVQYVVLYNHEMKMLAFFVQ